jgi:flagellar protein FlbB
MGQAQRIISLLIINLLFLFLSLYILDVLQILDYRQIIERVPFVKDTYAIKIENPYLLKELELDKKEQVLSIREADITQEMSNLVVMRKSNEVELERIALEKDKVQNMIDNIEKAKQEEAAYDKRIEEIAVQLENLPPANAARIIEKQDDLLIIDVFRMIDQRAEEAGSQSVVPGILQQMDPEQLARIQRKMIQ